MFARSDLAVIEASGPDTSRFLQGQLTCDVQPLKPGMGSWGGCCTPKGRLVAVFQLTCLDAQHFALVLPAASVETCLNHLNRYRVFFKTELTVTNRVVLATDSGPDWPDVALPLPERAPGWHHAIGPAGYVEDQPARSELVRAAELRAGIPWLLPEVSGEFIPQAVGLDEIGGVSFNKGCYTGQEVVARAHYRGKVKKHLATLKSPCRAQSGQKLTDQTGTPKGTVLACAQDAQGIWIEAVLDGHAEADTLYLDGQPLENTR